MTPGLLLINDLAEFMVQYLVVESYTGFKIGMLIDTICVIF